MSCSSSIQTWLTGTGILFVLAGSWCVAYEVVKKFRGISHTVSTGWGGEGTASKTVLFVKWEAKRNAIMWIGLVLITIGSLLQFSAVLC